MANLEVLRARVDELAERDWDLPAIEARFNKIEAEGFTGRDLNQAETVSKKPEILDRVQRRAEEYCYLTRNCAKGSATALLEEFGLGNLEIIKALAPFPGLGMTGGICGPVAGGLVVLGLYFSSDDVISYESADHYLAAREYTRRFEKELGSLLCPKIQEVVFGKYFDPMASLENLEEFNKAHAREKCPIAPGIGARIAAEIIIEDLEKKVSAAN
ncbi:MAG: C_GCAxxG_C_C family protein [Deltaproteobacteria bacterium]|nr:C_GCAxxG_C_C family protein [Deltaproteobacteria bacterium]MBW2051873.1 C_GCAxxG_C_C family protein [Deltaproteobacteria bacterium]MBW2141228.1 C_GCAxxG_C_C family protein [Deltaproteobacteria bacterium]